MSSAALEVQTAIFAILDADVTLSALVTGVFDDVPESYTDFPYVTLGEDVLTEFDTDGLLGFRVSVTIHCWSQYKGQREVKLIQDAIYRALHHVDMTAAGHDVILTRQVDQTSERDPDGQTRHGVQTFELLVRTISFLSSSNPSLIAMYTMDNISGTTLFDESPAAKDALLVGTVPTAPGVIGDAILTSTGNYANTNDVMGTPELGISGWINISSLAATNSFIFGRYSDSSFEGVFARITSGGQLTVTLRGSGPVLRVYQASGAGLVVDTDYHFVFNFASDATLTVFRGGTPFAMNLATDTGGLSSLVWPAGVDSWLGGTPDNRHTAAPGYFTGALDQFRYFDRVLSASEVTTLFAEGAP
jgi:hypothetical protein